MKAFILNQTGGVENLKLTEVETPQIKPKEVLVQVKAISINPVDTFVRQNPQALRSYLQAKEDEDTFIIGWDISGVVVEAGSDVTEFKAGDEVFGMVNFKGAGKAYAEYVAAPAAHLANKPANISHEEAAAATLAALTAWQALVSYANVKPKDKVLIHASAGGVGHYAIQIARHLGAYVIATGSSYNRDFVLGLGANEFIDYKNEKFEDKVKDADVVLDSIFGDHLFRSLEAVKNGGKLISILAFFEGDINDKIKEKGVQAERILVASNGGDIRELASLLEKGKLKSHVSAVFPFEELPKAHLQVETRRTIGKVVVKV